ncbi:hypothetical protein Gogos_021630 [Gossypium gossypioides]|uniref:RNase H type-1 domain-containing protein n=1 Tax=Gossypium gossypioides TaxID=34282 RepID=A0A7J9CWY4_GOSGO|nr:hypothetical protein [Gossypium gossypioides]
MRVASCESCWLLWSMRIYWSERCQLFCCALWVIWTERNKKLHEGKLNTGKEIVEITNKFLKEIDEMGNRTLTMQWAASKWSHQETQVVKINFDAPYDRNQFRSTSRLVARNNRGEVLASKLILSTEVPSPFAAEARACFQAVRMGLTMGVKKMEIEGDALTIIKKCQSTTINKLEIGVYIKDIQQCKSDFQSIQF